MEDPSSRSQTVAPPQPPDIPRTGAAAPTPPDDDGRPSGAKIGIALIIVGVVLLLAQFVPGVSWWQLWPLIIVAAGVIHAVTPGRDGWSIARLFDGFVTIAVGFVFFAIVTGVVSWRVWGVVLSLWPVLLISIGVDLLGKALGASWVRALGSLLVIAALGYAVAVTLAGFGAGWTFLPASDADTVEISESAMGVETASLRIEAGVATLEVEDGDELIEGTASSPFGTPELEVARSGTDADLELRLGSDNGAVWWPADAGADLDVALSRDVLWDIRMQTGVASVDANLSDVKVSELVLVPGVTDVSVRMGDAPEEVEEARLEVRSGVSSVRIELPRDAEVRIESDSGLTGQDIDERYQRTDGGWESDGYDDARSAGRPTWLVILKSGVGSVDVESY